MLEPGSGREFSRLAWIIDLLKKVGLQSDLFNKMVIFASSAREVKNMYAFFWEKLQDLNGGIKVSR